MTDVVTTTKDSHTVTLNNGKTSQPLNAGRPNTVKAKAGEHYRILQKAKTGEEQLFDNVIAKKSGDDLVLNYADGTQLTLENFYGECKAGGCDVTLAGQDAGGYSLAGASPAGAALGDGSTLAYAHGSHDTLMGMAQGNTALSSTLTGLQGAYIPSASGIGSGLGVLGGGLGMAAVAGGGGGGGGVAAAAAVPKILTPADTTAPNAISVALSPTDDGDSSNGVDLRVTLATDAKAGDTATTEILRGGVVVQTILSVLTATDISSGNLSVYVAAASVAVDGSYSVRTQLADPAGNRGNTVSNTAAFTVFTGLVHDDYLANAFVFVDSNHNNKWDAGEVTTRTDASGNFKFAFDPQGAPVLAMGGVDTASGAANSGVVYKAYTGSIDAAAAGVDVVLSPLSSLIAAVAVQTAGQGQAIDSAELVAAAQVVVTVLSLNISDPGSLLNFDPVAASDATGASASERGLLSANRQLGLLLSATAAMIDGAKVADATTATGAGSEMGIGALAGMVLARAEAETVWRPSNTADIEIMLQSAMDAANASGITQDLRASSAADLTLLSSVIGGFNARVDATTQAGTQSLDAVAAMRAASDQLLPMLRKSGNEAASDRGGDISLSASLAALATGVAGDVASYVQAQTDAVSQVTAMFETNAADGKVGRLVQLDIQLPSVGLGDTVDSLVLSGLPDGVTLLRVDPLTGVAAALQPAVGGVYAVAPQDVGYLAIQATSVVSGSITLAATNLVGGISTPFSGTLAINIGALPVISRATMGTVTDNAGLVTGALTKGARTDDATPTLSGSLSSALSGSDTVAIYDGAVFLGNATVTGQAWSFTSDATPGAALAEGAHELTARVMSGGQVQSASSLFSLIVDTQAPDAPLLFPSDGSAVVGTAEPGVLVQVRSGGTLIGTATADATGAWSITALSTLADGAALSATATDASGLISQPGTGTVSLGAPTQVPTLLSVTDDVAKFKGALRQGASTNDTTPTLQGKLSAALGAGVSLHVFDGDVDLGLATVSGTNWSFTPTEALGQGEHSSTVQVARGNLIGAASPAFSFNVDTQAPDTPVVDDVAGDGQINAREQGSVITGSAEPGATVALKLGAGNVRSAVADAQGVWRYTMVASDITAMGQGSESLTATATDAAGNTSDLVSKLITVDTLAPVFSSGPAGAVAENAGTGTAIYTAATTDGSNQVAPNYTLTGTDAALLGISSAGVVTLKASANFETKASYNFTLVATDAAGNASEKAVTLAINNLDEVAPSFTSGSSATAINENGRAGQVVYTATSTDTADIASGSTTYSLKTGSDAGLTISASTGAVTLTGSPDFETKASYSFTVVATDAAGNAREKPVTLAVTNLDEAAPTITSGDTATAITENTTAGQVVYTATSTDTADAATGSTSYSLKTGSDASAFSIDATSGAVTLTGAPNYETKPSYAFTVVATDAAGHASEQAVSLAVTNRDEVAPAFTSSATATAIDENTSAGQMIYTATSTDAADTATGATAYSLKAGSDAGLTIDATSGEVTLTDRPDFETKASYAFTVVATDAAGNTSEKPVTLAINDIEPEGPRVTSGASASAINENTSAGQVVYTATSNGVTGAAVYSLKTGSDAGLTIDPSTGAVTLTGSPDFETKASYSFTVVATGTDNAAAEKAVTLAITNLDEVAPSITSSATAAAINENTSAGQVVYTATSTDSADIATGATAYSLKANTGDASAFSISASTGAVTLTGAPNYETKASYAFTVVATDAAGHASEKAVTLAVTNLDETAPTITGGATATATAINEGSGTGQVVYTAASTDTTDYVAGNTTYSLKTGSDAGLTISASTGAVTLTGNPSYATKSSYAFTVVATDAANNPSEQAVSLAINEVVPGITSGATAAVNENIGSSTLVYTATSTGFSGTPVYSLKTGIGAGDGSSFVINPSTGAVTWRGDMGVKPSYESKSSYSFTVVATAGSTVFQKAVTLAINNLDEVAPTFTSGSSATALTENSGEGQLVYTATSTDTTDYIAGSTTYSLRANNSDDATAFSINASSGAVTLTGNPNYELKTSYRFTVIATDAAGNSANKSNVTLAITNVDDTAPIFTSSETDSANENSVANQVVYTAQASNNDDMATGSVIYSLKEGTGDVADFNINSSTGAVKLTGTSDYETKTSYSFTVVATDTVGNFRERSVTLSITNKDEVAPTITSAATATAIAENSGAGKVVYTATATDTVDLISGMYIRYSIKANTGDASAFKFNGSTGAVTLTGNPDYEATASYSFTVVATDNSGNATEKAVTLQVIDAVELTSIDENSNTGLNQLVYTATGGASYSLKPGSDTGLTIDTETGAVTLTVNPDYEVKRSYNFTVLVTDGGGTSTEQVLTFSITDVDDTAPSFSSPTTAAAAIDENSGVGQVIFTARASDPDSLSTVYSLKADTGDASAFTIDASTGKVTLTGNPDFETKPSYSFTVVATDPANNFSEQAVTLAINDLDETPPVMTQGATATATITEGESWGLQVYTAAATDLNDAGVDVTPNLRYSLKDGSDQDLQIDWQTGAVTLNGSLNFESKTSYSFTVVATDQSLNAVEQVVTLTVTNLDEVAPTFTSEQSATAIDENSGAGQVVYTALSTDTVDYVTGSTSYSLKADNYDDAAAFSIDASTGAVTLTGNPNYEAKSVYSFEVVATDEAGNYSQQSVTLLINDIEELFIDERSGANQVIYNASGASLAVSVDSTHFSYNAETGDVTLIDNPEFATQARYEFVLMTDIGDGIFTENRLQVEVIDSVKLTVNENIVQSQEVYTFTPVIGIDYRLKVSSEVSSALFNFSPAGSVSLGFIPDYENPEQAHHYSFTVVATDAQYSTDVYQLVTLAINNLDEVAPTITSSTNTLFVSEQSGADQVIYTATSTDTVDYVSGNTVYSLKSTDDASAFSIAASTGKVTLIANPDFGTQASYAFTVVATDEADNFSEQSLQLQVNPILALTPINENSGELQLVASAASLFESPSAGTLYSLKAATGSVSAFSIDDSTGEVTLTANPDYETKPSYSFTVVATDDKGVALEQPVRLAINNLDEVAPSITSDSSATAITENSGAGQVVYTATSIDTGDIATGNTVYSLKDTGDLSAFSINVSTGEVTLIANPDYEGETLQWVQVSDSVGFLGHSFTVVATDEANHSSEKAVTLAINNVDEAGPVFSNQSRLFINEKTGAGQVIYTANTYDPDYVSGDTTYTLLEERASAGGYYNYFRINASTGAVTLRDNPNYDVRSNYSFQVTATDAAGYSSLQNINLIIVDKIQTMTWNTDFYESRANDGTVNTVIKLQLTNEIFTGSNGDELSDTTFTNIPAGLTPLLIRTSDTTAELRLIGSAVAHASQDSLQIGVSLGDGDFTQTLASQITGSSINLGVTFASPGTQVSNFQYWGTQLGVFRAGVDQIGTPGDDSLIGTTGIETVIAGTGNDTLTGSGNSDALFGGAGNDTFVLNADFNFSWIRDLDKEKFIQHINGSPTPETLLARVDGGSGFDTIKFNGADFNPGFGASKSGAMSSIERIDMTGGGDQTLTFGFYDMLTYQDTNSFNNFNGWADGTYNLASGGANGDNPEQRSQMVIDGDAGDVVSSSGWGPSVGTVTHSDLTYNVYNKYDDSYAQLLINTAVTQNVL